MKEATYLKSDPSLNSPEFKTLKSARASVPISLKQGFDKFLNRRDSNNKKEYGPQLSHRSKVSNTNLSDDIYEDEAPKTSRLSLNKDLSPAKKIKAFLMNGNIYNEGRGDISDRNRNSINKPSFSQFEENFKEKIERVSLKSARYSKETDRFKKGIFSKGYSNDEIGVNNKNYLSLGKPIEEDIVDVKNSETEENTNGPFNIPSDIPVFVTEGDFKSQLQLLRKENSSIKYDINILLNQYIDKTAQVAKNNLIESQMHKELKEIKNSRNKLISEKVVMANELDFLKSSPLTSKISTERSDPVKILTSKEKTTTGSNHLQTKNNSDGQLDYNSIIDDLENKMSHFKLENCKFYENIDLLCDELVENEEKNKNLKNHIKQLERMIDTLMRERNTLKSTISKFQPPALEEASKKKNNK